MKRLTAIFAALMWIGSAQAAPINGSFESGLFGWLADPIVFTASEFDGQTPTDGNKMAVMIPSYDFFPGECNYLPGVYADCAQLVQFATVLPGETISFDWNFYDGDDAPFNDIAIYLIGDSGIQLLASAATPGMGWTGWQTTSYTNHSPFGSIGFAVANYGDTLYDSGLLIDNLRVPEPGTLALLGLGLLGFAFSRKRVA